MYVYPYNVLVDISIVCLRSAFHTIALFTRPRLAAQNNYTSAPNIPLEFVVPAHLTFSIQLGTRNLRVKVNDSYLSSSQIDFKFSDYESNEWVTFTLKP